ncbi:MAG: hypothetical protein LUC33_02000 [Prevotellaceae bacterium]|nr:hypothetical protein [Prevotellaceae bacterium]
MKKETLLTLALGAALPFSLGVNSVRAEGEALEGVTLELDLGGGTATRNDNTVQQPGGLAFLRWESGTSPVVTISEASSTANNIEFASENSLKLSEGGSTSFGYIISVPAGYYIEDLTLKGTLSAEDLSVTIDSSTELSAEEAGGEVQQTITGINKPEVRLLLKGNDTGESMTLTELSVKVAQGVPDPVDVSGMSVSSVSETVATGVEEGKWYALASAGSNAGGKFVYYNAAETDEQHATPFTEGTNLSDYVSEGMRAEDAAKYLIRFVPSAKTTERDDAPAYRVQWATGEYWSDLAGEAGGTKIHVSPTSIGDYNVYRVEGQTYFGMNVYDLGYTVNIVSGVYALQTNGSNNGYVTAGHANDHWNLYEVTLASLPDDEEAEGEALKDVVNDAFAALESRSQYVTSVDEGTSEEDPIGNGLISSVEQLSSPFTESLEHAGAQGGLAALIDGDSTTVWISTWYQQTHVDGLQYVQVELPDTFARHGGPVVLRLQRRGGHDDQDRTTEMTVRMVVFGDDDDKKAEHSGTEYVLASLDLSDNTDDYALIYRGFTVPEGVKYLRFYSENTLTPDHGCWHMAELQLFGTALTDDCPNALLPEAAALLQEATMQAVNGTETNASALREAVNTYLATGNEQEPEALEVTWKMTDAGWATLVLPFNSELPEGLAAYTCEGLEGSTLTLSPQEAIGANTPYIIEYTGDEPIESSREYTFSGVAEGTDDTVAALESDVRLTGTLVNINVPQSDGETCNYVLQRQDEGQAAFHIVQGEDITLNAYHCYLSLPATQEVKELIMLPSAAEDEGTTTAVEGVAVSEPSAKVTYDLSGRLAQSPRRGIYIRGGKKVVIR